MEKLGIKNTLEVIQSIGACGEAAVELVQGGITFGKFSKVILVLNEAKDIIAAAPGAMPELKDLDAMEAGQIGEAAYAMIKKIVEAVKK